MRTVAEVLRWRARRHPEGAATWFEGRTRTFGELDASSSELAAGLAAKFGIGPGDRLAILDRNSDAYLELILAAAKLGAVMVPINWRLQAPEVAQIVADAEPRLLVAGDGLAAGLAGLPCTVAGFGELPRGGTDPRGDQEPDVAWQLYTSGTTGLPKGAMLGHRNLFAMMQSLSLELPELVEGSRSLVTAPLYHIGGCGWALIALAHGATVVLVREIVPDQLLDVMTRQQVATGLIVPAVLQSLTRLPGVGDADFGALGNLAYGASPISQTLLEDCIRVFGCRLTQLYGLTETTGAVTALRHEDHAGERLLSCGRAMLGGEVKIEDGEILYRGPSLMQGYAGRPEDTALAVRDGWFHTGDAGTMDADGFVYIRDRIKDMIVSGGENVYPAELEGVLAGHPAIADAAVIGVPDPRWGETVKAVVVLRPGARLTETELIEWCRSRVAGYKRPRSVDFVELIPRNPSGKILKRQLREPYWAGVLRRVN
ncbi:MAG TPA: AMP-binding protein [Candidatus Dormibacteraeota bacterium]